VDVLPEPPDSQYVKKIRGWIKPRCPVERFLEQYSLNGGTHHAALMLGDRLTALQKFAFLAGVPAVVIP
jgi:L-arabinose isomerase